MQHSSHSSAKRARRTRRPSYKVLEGAELARASPEWKRRLGLVHPRKTTRVEVVVPTLRQVDARREHARERAVRERDSQEQSPSPQIKSEEEDAKMHCLLQARIKVEVKSEEIMSENIVRDRLALIGYDTLDIKVPRELLEVTTTRCVTSRIWGGCMRATFPKIGKEFTHGLHDFMYTCLLYDPHVPRWPGSPGLIFKFRDDGQEWPKIMRLIVRLRDNAWQYMGQYKLTAAPPLSSNEWHAQSLQARQRFQVRRRWATRLSQRRSDGGLKATIVLRKRLGRDPTPQEVAGALSTERFRATPDEILQACDTGQAAVCVWCMKCVGYDVDFQRRIAVGS